MEKMMMMKKKKMTFVTASDRVVEVDPIHGIESFFIRKKLKNGDGGRFRIKIFTKALNIILCYCERRAKIKLQHSLDDDDDDDENLKKFDSKFLQNIRRESKRDPTLPVDIAYAAVLLHIKSLYDLVLNDAVFLCDKMPLKDFFKSFVVGGNSVPEKISSSFNWVFITNGRHI